jgi:hypothetical protein
MRRTRKLSGSISARPGSPSGLSKTARVALDRTARARTAIDARVAGVTLDGGPPELGARRHIKRNTRFK